MRCSDHVIRLLTLPMQFKYRNLVTGEGVMLEHFAFHYLVSRWLHQSNTLDLNLAFQWPGDSPHWNCLVQPQLKVFYVHYYETWNVDVALHPNNIVFIDRELIIVPVPDDDEIPSEATAFASTKPTACFGNILAQ
ncbi:uncharacterized protein LOC118179988 [Stegodyphus dumicola]|uniref:uncharacterized protein LOC118179988 n=1 Tax=Stegodyphus dumicola TaxID=202533 RepID=UPI0015B2B5C2|nr:uncharacterized protein LOC118179988 [Stegodyphus dumicola]